jgi:autotransporter-associated beta strand protein
MCIPFRPNRKKVRNGLNFTTMRIFTYLLKTTLLLLITLSFHSLKASEKPMNADFVVALDGSGDFTKIQEAIDAVPSNSERRVVVYIKRGLYNTEKLIIPGNKKNITFIGESREETIISYHIFDCSAGKCPESDAAKWTGDNIRTSATLTIMGDGFRAENLTIQNTAGPVGQALAITVQADKVVFINCDFKSYQDTIYLWTAGKRSYFENCMILGRTDYIYGAGIAFFQGSEIRSWGGGWITAPSTPQGQAYGYVFNECRLTYALNSPRAGDDGTLVALGRPWHEYPKVAWLYCDFCAEIDPKGWPTVWNMTYAPTSADLHLYEYKNTGPGADMSQRASWVGIRALTDAEALNYTATRVMGGTDGWDPTAEAPISKSYLWKGQGSSSGWLQSSNWSPEGVPGKGESAEVSGTATITADGGIFEADLNMKDGAKLMVTATSTATYLSISNGQVIAQGEVGLSGKISVKAPTEIGCDANFTLNTQLLGIQTINKTGNGKLIVNSHNDDFSGNWLVEAGSLEAATANSIGKGGITIKTGASLIVKNNNAIQPKAPLRIENGALLVLDANVTISEFFIGGTLQPLGEYSAATNPGLISGTGKVIIGRPSSFSFIGGSNGNWDNPAHYSKALMPEAGETVYVEREMETTGTVFPADIVLVQDKGALRMRGNHKSTGTITMQNNTRISYATSGAGFSLEAPIVIAGDVSISMNSSNTAGNAQTLLGSISGSNKITALHSRDVATTATMILGGDNSLFDGIWDLTRVGANAGAVTAIKGISANAFGRGKIEVAARNKVFFDHPQCIRA